MSPLFKTLILTKTPKDKRMAVVRQLQTIFANLEFGAKNVRVLE